MVVFRQKEFSKFDTLDKIFQTAIPRVCLELMKCIEMYETRDVFHWSIEKVISQTIEEIKIDVTPQTLLCLGFENLNNKNLINSIGNINTINKFHNLYGSPEDFVRYIKNKLLTETKNGEAKYKSWFDEKPIQYSDEEYIDFYKYIALCLSGQLDPDVDDFDWNIEKVLKRTKVDYSIVVPKEELPKILAKSITNIVHRLYPTMRSGDSRFNSLLV